MNFVQRIFVRLLSSGDDVVLTQGEIETTARELREMVAGARAFLRTSGVARGDRIALLGGNSARWIALDLAIVSEGALTVPLYPRQAPEELAEMIAESGAALLLCDDRALLDRLEPARGALFEEAFLDGEVAEPVALAPDDRIRIVFTSGTSGRARGALYTLANVEFILPRTRARLDRLMSGHTGVERAYHYLPFCFAGSWILLLSCLERNTRLALGSDLTRLAGEMRAADPHYVLHVPLVLERIRQGLRARGGVVGALLERGWGRRLLGPLVRRRLAPRLRAFVCGSAPLAEETQRFFIMLGLPVLQVYGLTETTAICTMDEPGRALPGRVGPAVDGCEMRIDDAGEILVRGPNVFAGYWGGEPAPEWLPTGDEGDVDAQGRWRIGGRRRNLLVPAGGHNVAPEPIEMRLRDAVDGAAEFVLVGDGRPHLAALVAGPVSRATVGAAVERVNADLPHYQRVRGFFVREDPFTPGEGLLTANGKLKRAEILARFAREIEELYR